MNTPRKAVIYTRFSPRPDAETTESIETQLDRCDNYCGARGYQVVGEYSDRDMSGARADNRPGLQDALKTVCRLRGVLIVYSLTRLARNTKDAIEISDRIQKAGAELASINESIDTTTPAGKVFYTMIAAFAQFERESIAQRTSDAMLRHQASGRRMGHTAKLPFGYKLSPDDPDRIVPDEAEQRVLKRMVSLRKAGACVPRIVEVLEDEDVSFRGGRWHAGSVYRILARCDRDKLYAATGTSDSAS